MFSLEGFDDFLGDVFELFAHIWEGFAFDICVLDFVVRHFIKISKKVMVTE
jgi:hypothetical protein